MSESDTNPKIGTLRAEEAAALGYRDDKADLEANLLGAGSDESEIRKRALHDDYDRAKIFKNHFERVSIGVLYVAAIGLLSMAITWIVHVIAPQHGWLSHDQIDTVQNLLTGGILAGAFADHFRKRTS